MKILTFLILSHLILFYAFGIEASDLPSSSDVTVERLALSLPGDARTATHVLWTSFANKQAERRFGSLVVQGWRQHYARFVDELVNRAASEKLEADALRHILEDIDQKRGTLAALPVGAYRAT